MTRTSLVSVLPAILPWILLVCSPLGAAPPEKIGFQGRLTDAAGNPVNGTVNMTFRLYTAMDGGTAVWSQGSSPVAVAGGLYSVSLGDTPFAGLDFTSPYFVSVQVGTDAEMSPRYALLAGAYAMRSVGAGNADRLAGLSASSFAPATGGQYVSKSGDTMSGTLTLPADGLAAGASQLVLSGGKVGIGTAAPASLLEIRGAQETDGTLDLLRLRSGSTTNASVLRVIGTTSFRDFSRVTALQAETAAGIASNLQLNPSGGMVDIGTLSAGGFKLGVRGCALVAGNNANVAASGAALTVGVGTVAGEDAMYLHTNANAAAFTGTVGITFGQINLDQMAAVKAVNDGVDIMNRSAGLSFWTEPRGTGVPLVERMRITGPGNVGIGTTTPAEKLVVNGNASILGKLYLPAGSVAGTAALASGTAAVSTPSVTASSVILLSRNALGSSPGHLYLGAVTAGGSFVILSSDAGDNGTVNWLVIN